MIEHRGLGVHLVAAVERLDLLVVGGRGVARGELFAFRRHGDARQLPARQDW